MAQVTQKRVIDAPADAVWAVWDDFAAIRDFNPNISDSYLINGSDATGLGAERQCDFPDGKNWIKERITAYVPGRSMTIDIYEGTFPLKAAQATVTVVPLPGDRSEVSFVMEFTPKLGLIGQAMVPMMKAQFAKLLGKLVDGNKSFVEKRIGIAV